MPEIRTDPITGGRVIIAPERANRPTDLVAAGEPGTGGPCVFCEGHEAETPGEVLSFREPQSAPNAPGWRVRVVPNRFPAFEQATQPLEPVERIDFFRVQPAYGRHEVAIESPRHLVSITQLSQQGVREVVWAYRERLAALKEDSRLVYPQVFKNSGLAGGASLEHVHSQIMATPFVPGGIAERLARSLTFYRRHTQCVFCDLIRRELAAGERIVSETPEYVVLCPFASRVPYETWILPKAHASHFEQISSEVAGLLALVLQQTLARIEGLLEVPAYNYLIHTSPFDTSPLDHYHWTIEIVPRVTKVAGFEWGTGIYINPVPPEDAASLLRW
jgi:UDPglucose--hexose-1-phosphate uridylyltransferase